MLSLAKDINILKRIVQEDLRIDILSLVLAVNAVNLRISVLRCNAFHSACLVPIKSTRNSERIQMDKVAGWGESDYKA